MPDTLIFTGHLFKVTVDYFPKYVIENYVSFYADVISDPQKMTSTFRSIASKIQFDTFLSYNFITLSGL